MNTQVRKLENKIMSLTNDFRTEKKDLEIQYREKLAQQLKDKESETERKFLQHYDKIINDLKTQMQKESGQFEKEQTRIEAERDRAHARIKELEALLKGAQEILIKLSEKHSLPISPSQTTE